MKNGKVFFHPIDGSGSLTISWSALPKGSAVEAKKGDGVGFFSEKGDLLCVIFDEVREKNDHQILEFQRNYVEITITNGRVFYNVSEHKIPSRSKVRPQAQSRVRRRRSKHKQTT